MLSRDYRDVVGGAVLTVFGVAFALYAFEHYEIGTLRRMGPGMPPVTLGVLLAAFGLMISVPALFRNGRMPEILIWEPLCVLLAVAAFAAAIRSLGLIPAVLAVVVISSFAEKRVRPVGLAVLCITLCLIAWLTFSVILGLPIPLATWPF